ncbi:TPA: hypothetical protein N0F65_011840 [Lagenidium giganteum]|uniref:RING-type domain-containing protein n=1 Tax=Lagenidium giganteum TaxID=4803 RepID=A0AAV2YYZ0_9STRA|nr:TPA: hypothetical protein N0F65_011840 [Lagenidium giganteum]
MRIHLSKLTEHLGCVLCHGMLRDAQTIPECLHSFCKSCIYRHFLVQGSRNCPKCFLTLKPRPITTLISDQQLQDIVDKIFPELRKRDAVDEKEFYARHNFPKKPQWMIDQQQAQKNGTDTGSRRRGSGNPSHSNSNGAATATASATDVTTTACNNSTGSSSNGSVRSVASSPAPTTTTSHKRKAAQTVLVNGSIVKTVTELSVQVYPFEDDAGNIDPLPALTFPYLQVEGSFKIFELRKLIQQRLNFDPSDEIEITCMGATVGPELSLLFIQRTIWHQHHERKPIILHYRRMLA